MSLKLITPAATLAVTLAEAKAHIRQDLSDDDALITVMITAATELAEQHMGARAIMPQTWELSEDCFQDDLQLGKTPVSSVTSVKYMDVLGVEQTMDPSAYVLNDACDAEAAEIVPAYLVTWPAVQPVENAVKVRFVCGYADAAHVPESIKTWIKMMVGSMYENRESEIIDRGSVLSLGFVDRLLDRYKVY